MAQLSITIPDAVLNRVLDAFAAQYGWTAESGVTKAQFARQKVSEFAKDVVRGYEANQAAEVARAAAIVKADSEVQIT